MRRTLRSSRAIASLALALAAAACTDGDDGAASTTVATAPPTTTTTTTASPETTTTVATSAPVTAAPTTTMPPPPTTVPGLQAGELAFGLVSGDLAEYQGSIETTLAWSGERAGEALGLSGASTGSTVTSLSGTVRLLALDAAGGLEIIEDFLATDGRVTVGREGEVETMDLTRRQLNDITWPTPPLFVDGKVTGFDGSSNGTPQAFARRVDPLFTASVLGPPLGSGEVDVGVTWSVSVADPIAGLVAIDVAITGEEELAEGGHAFVLEFDGRTDGDPRELGLAEALDLAGSFAILDDIELLVPTGATGSAVLRTADLSGRVVFDPASGAVVTLDTAVAVLIDFTLDDDGDEIVFTVESSATRSLSLTGVATATPFERSSVLDRFRLRPERLAEAAIDAVREFAVSEAPADIGDPIRDRLLDIREDLLAGTAVAMVEGEGGDRVVAVAVTTGGEFRGAPFVAEEVAAFLSTARPRTVTVGGRRAFRVPIESEDWLLYNNETHLFIVVGTGRLAESVMGELAAGSTPYLWRPGDCLDFTDDFGGETPYAPFGLHGLRHCAVDHVYEVIHSEVLPEGPTARFPSDLSERSQSTCGRAFVEFAGGSELQSALSLIRYLPDEDEWAKGARYFACVVYVGGSAGRRTIRDRIDGSDPAISFSLEVGTCLTDLFVVECDAPHDREIVAMFDLPDGPGAPFPDERAVRSTMVEMCNQAFEEFDLGDGPGQVRVFDLTDLFTFWDSGVRRYYCIAIAFGTGGRALEIIGTFAGGWEEAAERVTA